MKGILFYFSGTGNTKWAADRIKERFEFYGSTLELSNIELNEENNINNYEYLVIGMPIHAESAPRIVSDFVKQLPKVENDMKCIVYSTQRSKRGSAVDYIEKLLKVNGYKVIVKACIQMPNNYHFISKKEQTEEDIKELMSKAGSDIKQLVIDFINEDKTKVSSLGIRQIVDRMANNIFYKSLHTMSKSMTSGDECNKCGLCLRNCPVGNITFENGHALFHSKCIMCLRCIYICPVNSIKYNGRKTNQTQKNIISSLDIR
jgi:ferredoxin/flavodoxin